jgi:predicted DNA-binding transcriptional regulator AlpA
LRHTLETGDCILRPRAAAAALGVSKVTLWRLRQRGELPEPIRISPGAVGWRSSTLARWLDERERIAQNGGAVS